MNPIVRKILLGLATAAIAQIETEAVNYYLENGVDLKGKADEAKKWIKERYDVLQKKSKLLAMTTIDDMLVDAALEEAWQTIDERVKQAARDVKKDLPRIEGNVVVQNQVQYTAAPPAGIPTEKLAPSMAVEPPGEKD